MQVELGATVELRVERLVAGGQALARSPDYGVIFVKNALPGEELSARITARAKNYSTAEIENIVSPSKHRVRPQCPYFLKCGACQWQFMDYSAQLEQKIEIAFEAFHRNFAPKFKDQEENSYIFQKPIIKESQAWHARSKFRFLMQAETQSIGLRAMSSHRLVDIEYCLIADEAINKFIKHYKTDNNLRLEVSGASTELNVFGFAERYFIEDDELALSQFPSLLQVLGPAAINTQLRFKPRIFFQNNLRMLRPLFSTLLRALGQLEKHASLWDLYAGVGIVSAFLAREFKTITALESNAEAAKYAKLNLPGQRVHKMKVEKFLKAAQQGPDLIIVNPPRSGLAPQVRQELRRLASPMIIYLSCDPVSFARDIHELMESYKLVSWELLDFYPQTSHIESLAILKIK